MTWQREGILLDELEEEEERDEVIGEKGSEAGQHATRKPADRLKKRSQRAERR